MRIAMIRTRSNRFGFTLLEVIVIITIVAIMSSILYSALKPSGEDFRADKIRSDLRVASQALSLYRTENNNAFPADWREMGFEKPNPPKYVAMGAVRTLSAPPSYPESWRTQESTGLTELSYLYHLGVRNLIGKYEPKYLFDEHEHPVFTASFFQKLSPGNESAWSFAPPDMSVYTGSGKVKARRRLGGFTDGHVKWGPEFELWEMELLYKMEFEGILK